MAAPIGLSPLLILTLCGPEPVLVVSTEPLDDLSRLTNQGWLPRRRAVARAVDQVHPDAHSESMLSLPIPALTCARWGVHLQGVNRGGGGIEAGIRSGLGVGNTGWIGDWKGEGGVGGATGIRIDRLGRGTSQLLAVETSKSRGASSFHSYNISADVSSHWVRFEGRCYLVILISPV